MALWDTGEEREKQADGAAFNTLLTQRQTL